MKNRDAILERDSYRCRACGVGSSLHVHHIVYRSHGGTDDMDNLVTLCYTCHQQAHRIGGTIEAEELFTLVREDRHNLQLMRRLRGR